MRLWSILLSLAMAGVIATGAFAQEGKPAKEHGKKGGRPQLSFADMDANKDGKLTKDEFIDAHLKNVPEDRKEAIKDRLGKRWAQLAGDKTELTEAEFTAAREKIQQERKSQGGKRHGEKGGPGPKPEKPTEQ